MDPFLDKHVPLINKNLIMVISIGSPINKNIFNKRVDKDRINNIIHNIKNNKYYKYKIFHTSGIKEYKYNNTIYLKYASNLDYNIYNNIDTLRIDNLHFEVIQIHKDTFMPSSINNFNHIENYDMMTININNSIPIFI